MLKTLLPIVLLAASASAAPADSDTIRGPNGYALVDGDLHVAVTLSPRSSWKETTSTSAASFVSAKGSRLEVTLSPKKLPRKKGRTTSTHTIHGRVLTCAVTAGKSDAATVAEMKAACAKLPFEIVPDDGVAWAVTVSAPTVKAKGTVTITIAATNHGTGPVTLHRDPLSFFVDGQESMDLDSWFGNGGRGAEWDTLPAGATATDARDYQPDAPGDHVISIGRYDVEYARVTLHVDK